jgi:hypothetical protein
MLLDRREQQFECGIGGVEAGREAAAVSVKAVANVGDTGHEYGPS